MNKLSGKATRAGAVALVLLGWLAAPHAAAVVVTNGCTGGSFADACGLDELVAGGSFSINGSLFSDFQLNLFDGRPVDAAAIRVDALDSTFNPGFTLVDTADTLRTAAGAFTLNDFQFKVTVPAGPLSVQGASLQVGGAGVSGDGSYTQVFETVLSEDFVDVLANMALVCDSSACPGDSGASFAGHKALAVLAGIDVFSVDPGSAGIDNITMRFLTVAEPGSLALLSLGLGGLVLSVRRRKQSQE